MVGEEKLMYNMKFVSSEKKTFSMTKFIFS